MYRQLIIFCLLGSLCIAADAQDLYDIYRVRDLKLRFTEQDWEQHLDSLKQVGSKRLLGRATVDQLVFDSVGVRYKGNSSYFNVRNTGSTKLPFNIKLDYKIDGQAFEGGYETFKLSNIFRDPSFLREVMSYEIARKYMPAPKANFIRLYVNDTLLGIYNNTESVDEAFLEKHFGWGEGVLVKCDPNWHAKTPDGCDKGEKASLLYLGSDSLCYKGLYEMKTDHGWRDLIELCQILDEDPSNVDDYLNIDRTLWMHAFNNLLVNLDSYAGRLCHNYYLYKDSFGIFQPILWDMNLSFGGFRFDGSSNIPLSNEKMQKLSPFTHYKNPKRPLISKLLATPLYRKVYIAHLRTILKDNFTEGQFARRTAEVQRTIDSYIKNDENKLYPYEAFQVNIDSTAKAGKSNIIGLEELMDARTQYLSEHPLLKKDPPAISEVVHNKSSDAIQISARIQAAQRAYLMYRYHPHAPFQETEMLDDGANNDGSAADQVYGASIKLQPGAQYYIIAEAEKIAQLSPERAAFEFYEVR
ncbi:MAG: CotH kinase family protein [Bacteroidota bacterium]